LKITANIKTADGRELPNGTLCEVKGFSSEGEILLSNGARLEKNCAMFTHGYAITSNVAQSKSVDCVFIAQSGQSLEAGYAEQFYVSASRGKQRLEVFTDNLEALKDVVSFSRGRVSASEIGFARPPKEAAAEMPAPAAGHAKPLREALGQEQEPPERQQEREDGLEM